MRFLWPALRQRWVRSARCRRVCSRGSRRCLVTWADGWGRVVEELSLLVGRRSLLHPDRLAGTQGFGWLLYALLQFKAPVAARGAAVRLRKSRPLRACRPQARHTDEARVLSYLAITPRRGAPTRWDYLSASCSSSTAATRLSGATRRGCAPAGKLVASQADVAGGCTPVHCSLQPAAPAAPRALPAAPRAQAPPRALPASQRVQA